MQGNFHASKIWTKNFRKNDFNKLTIPIRNLVVPITDPGAANGFGTAVIAGLPQGDYLFIGSVLYARLTKLSAGLLDAFAGSLSVGTGPTADATLNEAEIIAATAFTTAASGVSAYTRYPGTAGTFTRVDNLAGALELNFNCFITDATLTTAASLAVDGVLHLACVHLGDDNS